MPTGIGSIGGNRDLLSTSSAGGKNFVTITDAAGIRIAAPEPVAAPEPAGESPAVASLTSVADASSTALESLAALSSSVSQFSSAAGPAGASASGTAGKTAAAAGPEAAVADFGSISINGVKTVLGSVQSPYMTGGEAASFVASAINANSSNTVLASVTSEGKLELKSKNGSNITIDSVGGSTTGIAAQMTGIGLTAGTHGPAVTADTAIGGPGFAKERRRQAAAAAAAQVNPAGAQGQAQGLGAGKAAEAADAAARAADRKPLEIETSAAKPASANDPQSVKLGYVELQAAPAASTGLANAGAAAAGSGDSSATSLIRDVAAAQGAQVGGQTAAQHIALQTTRAVLESLTEEVPDAASASTVAASAGPAGAPDLPGTAAAPVSPTAGGPPAPAGLPGKAPVAPGPQQAPGLSLTA